MKNVAVRATSRGVKGVVEPGDEGREEGEPCAARRESTARRLGPRRAAMDDVDAYTARDAKMDSRRRARRTRGDDACASAVKTTARESDGGSNAAATTRERGRRAPCVTSYARFGTPNVRAGTFCFGSPNASPNARARSAAVSLFDRGNARTAANAPSTVYTTPLHR